MATFSPLTFSYSFPKNPTLQTTNSHPIFRLSAQSPETIQKTTVEYNPGLLDHVFLNLFRNKMVQEVGWDSKKPGYDGLIDVANRLMLARTNSETKEAAWLMGTCKVNDVDLPDGSSLPSGVFVERCKYLEESKCVGICVNTCKLPTQAFFMDHMGVPLLMEPNFDDYSCQFKFGITPPEEDGTLKEPCLEICPNAARRRIAATNTLELKCPKA